MGEKMSKGNRQRKAAHNQRKAATLRKEARRYKDGMGKQRRAVLKEQSNG